MQAPTEAMVQCMVQIMGIKPTNQVGWPVLRLYSYVMEFISLHLSSSMISRTKQVTFVRSVFCVRLNDRDNTRRLSSVSLC